MKKSALIVLLIILSKFGVFAQNSEPINNKNSNQVQPLKKHGTFAVNSTTGSEYNNMDVQIKNMMIDGLIPDDFPKYTYGTSKEKYDAVIDIWVKNNSTKVKPEHRKNTVSTDK